MAAAAAAAAAVTHAQYADVPMHVAEATLADVVQCACAQAAAVAVAKQEDEVLKAE